MNKIKSEKSEGEDVERAGAPPLPADRSMPVERANAVGSGQATGGSANQRRKLPPDLRTEDEKAEDERAEALYWEERLADGYDAARDYVKSAKANTPRWRFLGWLRFGR
ncbi:hypothetical protein [Burkholderia gladioli]|uniref:hypothetical protein n=1 Tax=Burkholderia gladioli TaxID=28095 RepID=UPI00164087F0|nr:hypothetical protein [Burkholderia gladioli]